MTNTVFAVLTIYFLCRVHWTSAMPSSNSASELIMVTTPSPNTLSASGLTVRAIAGDTYLDQEMDNSPWKIQEQNKSLLLYICNRVAYRDLLNATRESENLKITTDKTARAMSVSMDTLCKIVFQNGDNCDVEEFLSQARLHCPAILLSQHEIWASKMGANFFPTEPQKYTMDSTNCEKYK